MKTFLKYAFPIVTIVILIVAVWLSHQPGDISGMESSRIAAFFAPAFYFAAHCHAPRSDFCRRRIFYAKENAHASNKKPYNLS